MDVYFAIDIVAWLPSRSTIAVDDGVGTTGCDSPQFCNGTELVFVARTRKALGPHGSIQRVSAS
jgi:hypothetical protein